MVWKMVWNWTLGRFYDVRADDDVSDGHALRLQLSEAPFDVLRGGVSWAPLLFREQLLIHPADAVS